MIHRNFQLALDAQIKTSIEENNLLQSTIEYRLLDTINSSPSNLVYQMKNLSADVVGKMGGNNKGVEYRSDRAEAVHDHEGSRAVLSVFLFDKSGSGQKDEYYQCAGYHRDISAGGE